MISNFYNCAAICFALFGFTKPIKQCLNLVLMLSWSLNMVLCVNRKKTTVRQFCVFSVFFLLQTNSDGFDVLMQLVWMNIMKCIVIFNIRILSAKFCELWSLIYWLNFSTLLLYNFYYPNQYCSISELLLINTK